MKRLLSYNKVTLCLPRMLCTQESKTETSCCSGQLAECAHTVERLGHMRVAKNGEKVSPCTYRASLVSRFALTKDAAAICLRKEVAEVRGAGKRNLSKVIIQYIFMECPVCAVMMMNKTVDYAFFQSFQYNWEKDKKICNYNATR